jgi:hypothetical protein
MAITPVASTDPVSPLENLFNTQAAALQAQIIYNSTADLASLNGITATAGLTYVVLEGGALFVGDGTKFVQLTNAKFATTGARDTAYAKASAAYKVQGATATDNTTYTTYTYLTSYNSSTNAGGALAAGWYPTSGNKPRAVVQKSAVQAMTTTATPVVWNTTGAVADRFGLSSVVNTTRLTAPAAGLYQLSGVLAGPSAGIGVLPTARLNAAGVLTGGTAVAMLGAPGSYNTGVLGWASLLGYVPMAAGDYVEVFCALTASGNLQPTSFICLEYLEPRSLL